MTAVSDVSNLVVENPHALPAESVLTELGTGTSGLSTSDSAKRLLIAGHNRLPEAARVSPLQRFLRQFNNLLILIFDRRSRDYRVAGAHARYHRYLVCGSGQHRAWFCAGRQS